MHITDARTEQSTELLPHRAGLLRVTIHAGPHLPFGIGDLRALLVGDLLARTAEAIGLQVITHLTLPDGSEADQAKALLKQADLLGIRPPADTIAHPITDLHIVSRRGDFDGLDGGPVLAVGPVTPPEPYRPAVGVEPLGGILPDGVEPLAVRLILLGHPHRDPVRLTSPSLADAQAQLVRWRSIVADLARFPSRPLATEAVQAVFEGLADDLDARPALGALRDLETRTDLPPGGRFETYLRIDQFLALELGRYIGRDQP